MAVTFVDDNYHEVTSLSITPPMPTQSALDTCVVTIQVRAGDPSTDLVIEPPDASWRLIRKGMSDGAVADTIFTHQFVTDKLGAGEGDPTFVARIAHQSQTHIAVFRGCDNGQAVRRHSRDTGFSNTATSNAVDTEVDGTMALLTWGTALAPAVPGVISDGTWTERVEEGAGQFCMFAYTKAFATAGSTGAPSNDFAGPGSDDWICSMIVLQPPRADSTADVQVWTGTIGVPHATGTITTPAAASINDGDQFVIDDGFASRTFEFDLGGGGITGDVAVVYVGTETATQMRDLIKAAINGEGAPFRIIASDGAAADIVALITGQDRAGSQGNNAITDTGITGFSHTGLTGGTGIVDYLDPGFDVKAIKIVFGYTADVFGAETNVNLMVGFGADDGVTAKSQGAVGHHHENGVGISGDQGWSDDDAVVKDYIVGNTTLASPDYKAIYSKIAGGFRLDWTFLSEEFDVEFRVTAYGGDDFRAVHGKAAASSSAITGLPWRPNMVHAATQQVQLDTPQIRGDAPVAVGACDDQGGQMSLWIDPETSSQAIMRNTSFIGYAENSVKQYGLGVEEFTSDGITWFDSPDFQFFFLAMNFNAGSDGNMKEFRYAIDQFICDDSGTNNTDQTLPPFDDGTVPQVMEMIGPGEESDSDLVTNSTWAFGTATDFDATIDQYMLANGKAGSVAERDASNAQVWVGDNGGDVDAPDKVGVLQDDTTIRWTTNDTQAYITAMIRYGEAVIEPPPGGGQNQLMGFNF